MERKVVQQLLEWQAKKKRNPLILKGVRQSGKTYTLNAFGEAHYPAVHTVNFERQTSLHSVFEGDLDPAAILQQLGIALNKQIRADHDFIFFDEIQACPRAITSLKYFSEEMPQINLAAAGSLLGLELTPASFPVGKVDYLEMRPMSFAEFLMALEDSQCLDYLNALVLGDSISQVVHERLWQRFKWYLIVGGLPEVVREFVAHQESLVDAFGQVREKQITLLQNYYADIAKHPGKENAMHIERIFHSVPAQLARTQNSAAPRFQFGYGIPGVDRYQQVVGCIDWLDKARLIIRNKILSHSEMPLSAQASEKRFKLYCFDVGMLNAMNDIPPAAILQYGYGSYKGYVAENFVAQELAANSAHPFYCWQQERSEIEFVQAWGLHITPIEVKAGHIRRAKSLEKYRAFYKPERAVMLSGDINRQSADGVHTLPLYMAGWLEQLFGG